MDTNVLYEQAIKDSFINEDLNAMKMVAYKHDNKQAYGIILDKLSYKEPMSVVMPLFVNDNNMYSLMTNSTNQEASGTFTVPSGLAPLSTLMRVSMTNDEDPAGSCDSFNFGEVEDYTIHITDIPLGMDDSNLLSGIRLFPNPVNDNIFYIEAPRLNGETVSILVSDMLGREIINDQQTFSGTRLKVNFSPEIVSGMYMVKISAHNEQVSLRIIKR